MSTEERSVNQPEEQSLSEQRLIRRAKLKELQEAGQDPFQITKYVVKHHSADIKENFEALEGSETSIAGRIMSKRGMGKAMFCDLQDVKGRIQLYVRIDELGEEAFAKFKKIDIGDIVGVEGEVFKTKRGEISVKAHKVTLLSKSLQPLPEKFHGLTDKETRYRQRYVDLIMNEDVRRTFQIRTAFIKHVRKYLDDRDYLEVETPVLNTISGGATARPFITHHNTLDIDMYMRIATELNLKRLTVGGFERVYEIGRIFRNEGMDPKHNPEFTTIELYEAYADFHDMMDIAEGILSTAAKDILGSYQVNWLGVDIDLTPGWPRLTMTDAVKEYVGVDFDAISDDEEACRAVEAKGIDMEGCERTWGTALYEAFDQRVEEKLVQPTFITMYPVEVSPLTKRSPKDPRLTERFELFINHCEFANAFSELNDPIDQRGRFEHELALRDMGNDEAGMMDEDFINALEYGLPPTGGMGIGIDRAVMLLTNSDSIRDVILFPTMKPLEKVEAPKAAAPAAAANVDVPRAEAGPIDFSKVEIEPLFKDEVDFDTFSKSDFRAVKVKECTAVPKSKKLLKFVLDDGTGTDRVILSGIHDTYEPEELVGKTLIAITNLPARKMMGIDSCGMIISAIHYEEGQEKLHCLMVDDHIPAGAKLY
ncbi:lysine--tRNA ligase [uncultured Flavonifractor sp.]|uniref:lysine--tRNA ligase n=1 Tax=uncultured Flavonifractor sp. TaxID=1193534 RepID=UPI0026257240|nr:lysine--tRNA ligase [uncultured Flavonifractor sp.]